MLNPNAPTEYVIRNHKLFTYVNDGVVITDTRDPRVINFIANRNYDVEYPDRVISSPPVLTRGLRILFGISLSD